MHVEARAASEQSRAGLGELEHHHAAPGLCHPCHFGETSWAVGHVPDAEGDCGGGKQGCACSAGLNIVTEDFLEVGQAVIATEAHFVAEEGEKQRIGHRLGDD